VHAPLSRARGIAGASSKSAAAATKLVRLKSIAPKSTHLSLHFFQTFQWSSSANPCCHSRSLSVISSAAAAPHRDVSTLRARGLRNYATFLQIAEALLCDAERPKKENQFTWGEESLHDPICAVPGCKSKELA